MTRAESLARLSEWAEAVRDESRVYPTVAYKPHNSAPARSHGLAAVRAIREGLVSPPVGYDRLAYNEARLAVRCALAAVGLKTL